MRIALFILIVFISNLMAAQISFTASAGYSSVPLSSNVKVTYTLTGGTAETFTRPSFDGFKVTSEYSSTGGGGMQIIVNGQRVNSNAGESKWEFTLRPLKVGKFTIGPAKVRIKGKYYSSNSVSIQVTSAGAAVRSSGQPANTNVSPDKNVPQASSGGQEVFMTAVPSKKRVYAGEQFTVSYRLYTQYDIQQFGIEKTPSMDGFWTEELTDTQTPAKIWYETVNGKRYLVAEIRTIALIAQKTGNLTVPSFEIEALVKVKNQSPSNLSDLFDQMMNDPLSMFGADPFADLYTRVEKRKLSCSPFSVQVMPLPENGKVDSYHGAVGTYEVTSKLDRNSCATGDAVVLSITVSGKGNLPLLELNAPRLPDGFESFDPDISDNFVRSEDGLSGSRTFEFLLQPTVPGTFDVSAGDFTFFNPANGTYQTIQLPTHPLTVVKGKGSKVDSKKQLNEDILYIHDYVPSLIHKNKCFVFSPSYWGVVLLLLVVFTVLLYYFRSRIRLRADLAEFRVRMAMRQARHRLKSAQKALNAGQRDLFYSELSKALWLYMTDKFTIPFSELSLSNAHEILLRSNVPTEIAEAFSAILEECEFTRFAPAGSRMSETDLYNKAAELIVKVQTHAIR